MSEWREVSLGSLLKLITKGTTPPKGKGFVEHGINYIKSDAINYNSRIDVTKFVAIDKGTHHKFKRSQLEELDILFSMAGAYLGKNGIVLKYMLPANTNQALAILRVNQDLALPYYISQFLGQSSMVDYINNMSGQSAQPNINFQEISSIEINLPPLPEQKAITEVLSSLDDKIDLLHRQNKTLEQMAETLFRQWFVEEAGEDWGETTLGGVINISSGKGLKKEKLIDNGKYPVLGANGEIGRTNDFLFDRRLLYTGRVGTLGNVFRVENKKVWLSDNTLVIKPNKFYNFIYFLLKNAKLEQYNVGSTQPLIRQSDIKEIEVLIPEESQLILFEKESDLLFGKINKNQKQIRTLESLRDTLLPKLMSGEVRIASNG